MASDDGKRPLWSRQPEGYALAQSPQARAENSAQIERRERLARQSKSLREKLAARSKERDHGRD